MQVYKTPLLVQWLYPSFLWRKPTEEKTIYLTFDDGPIPEVTPWVLKTLASFNAKATFFCVGENVSKNPDVFRSVVEAGHAVGNHTYHHLNGMKTAPDQYLKDFLKCEEAFQNHGVSTQLFRPPYGRISRRQAQMLSSRTIVMWDVLTYDFSKKVSPESVLKKSIQHTKAGSIVVFHDSIKASENLKYALPKYLDHFHARGYTFKTL